MPSATPPYPSREQTSQDQNQTSHDHERNQNSDRTPSPPPLPPTALHPGPRATAFNTLYTNTLAHTLKTISYENFAACFPNIARQVPGSLAIMHGEMIARLKKFATDEFALILQERTVIPSLNSLEDLLATARRLQAASAATSTQPPPPPHTLPPTQILTAHLTPHLTSQQSILNAKLQTVQSQNATLFSEIQEQEREIEMLLKGLEGVMGDLEGAVRMAGDVLMDEEEKGGLGIVGEVRDVEVEMGGI